MALRKLTLFHLKNDRTSHGGGLRAGKRKERRPVVPKRDMHIVVRSSKARGERNFLRPDHAETIDWILHKQAEKHFVKLLEFVNVGNHLHLKVKAYSRSHFQAFLISITALIARAVTGARRGHPFGKFWDALAFSRVLHSSLETARLTHYFRANEIEALFGKEARMLFMKDAGSPSSSAGRI